MNKICLPQIRVPNSRCTCYNHQIFDRSIDKQSTINSFVWERLYRTATNSSYRQSCYYDEINSPKNDLDFRLRTCYNHAQETFASKARIVVQPITIHQIQKSNNSTSPSQLNPFQRTTNYPFIVINKNRKEHFNEATKGQHIGPNNFANGKHGYSRVVAGAISVVTINGDECLSVPFGTTFIWLNHCSKCIISLLT